MFFIFISNLFFSSDVSVILFCSVQWAVSAIRFPPLCFKQDVKKVHHQTSYLFCCLDILALPDYIWFDVPNTFL